MSRVVLLAREDRETGIVYRYLASAPGIDVVGVILEQPKPPLALLKRRMKRLGVTPASVRRRSRYSPRCWHGGLADVSIRSFREAGLEEAPPHRDLVQHVPSINHASTPRALEQLGPAVVVVKGTRIIRKKVLSSIDAPFVNVHAGITPKYRGVHGGYWALAEGDREHCGVTVHLIDRGIDTGGILEQAVIEPGLDDNFATYPTMQLVAALPLLARAVRRLAEGDRTTTPNDLPSCLALPPDDLGVPMDPMATRSSLGVVEGLLVLGEGHHVHPDLAVAAAHRAGDALVVGRDAQPAVPAGQELVPGGQRAPVAAPDLAAEERIEAIGITATSQKSTR